MDLPTMRARVRRDLRDSDAAQRRWSDDDLDRHVARAVRELSLAAPDEASSALTASAGSRDLDVSALADRVSIDAVEYPAGRWPRAFAAFSVWGDTLTLLVADAPAGGDRAPAPGPRGRRRDRRDLGARGSGRRAVPRRRPPPPLRARRPARRLRAAHRARRDVGGTR